MKQITLLITILFSSVVAFAAPALNIPAPPPVPLSPVGLRAIPEAQVSELRTFGAGVPLAEFLRITLGDMLKRPYVLAPEAAGAGQLIAADLTRFKGRDVLGLVREILAGNSLHIRDVQGVLFVEASAAAAKPVVVEDVFVYSPKHRSVGSMSTYFSMFPALTFSYSAGLAVRTPVADPAGAASPTGAVGSSMSSGGTTFSQFNKDPSFLVVKGATSELNTFKNFLAQVDVPVPEVLLKAYVFEVRDSSSADSAVSLVSSILGGKLGLAAGAAETGVGDALRLTLPSLSLAIKSLTSDSRVRLVSSPTLRASDGTTASATIGTDTPTLGSIVSQNGSTLQSVSYQSAGVILSVSPTILSDSIRLSISQELSSFVTTDTGLSGTPTKLRRAFKSDVVARSGESLLLGGLSEAQSTTAKAKSFSFFGSDSDKQSSSQIVVLLQVDKL